jgi:cyanophycinase
MATARSSALPVVLSVLLAACRGGDEPKSGAGGRGDDAGDGGDGGDAGDGGDGGDGGGGDSGAITSPGPIIVAGGGTEGEVGEPEAWSARLYAHLLDAGDVSGDGRVEVLVLSAAEESEWIPEYLVSLGADGAENLRVSTREAADDEALNDRFAAADAVFIKGGDQGEYYDLWNDRAVEAGIRAVREAGGGLGGTSAGAMSLAGFALAGGRDLISSDVLADACTRYLDDQTDGGSAIHPDFLDAVPGTLIDTHFTERGRLGRLTGALARAVEDSGDASILGVGLEQQTGLWIEGGRATVIGVGSVAFLRADPSAPPLRECGRPLQWTGLSLGVLTDGWVWDLTAGGVLERPSDAVTVAAAGAGVAAPSGWAARGGSPEDEENFGLVVERGDAPFRLRSSAAMAPWEGAFGLLDAHNEDRRAVAQEAAFAALAEEPSAVGWLVGAGSRLEGSATIAVRAGDDPAEAPLSALILDGADLRATGRSATVSPYDAGDGGLHAAALEGLRLDVLYSDEGGATYDPEVRRVESP